MNYQVRFRISPGFLYIQNQFIKFKTKKKKKKFNDMLD